MLTLTLNSAQPLAVFLSKSNNGQYSLSTRPLFPPSGRPAHLICHSTFTHFNPLGVSIDGKEVMKRKPRRSGAVCYSLALSPSNLRWISTISTAVLMLASGTAAPKSFLVPLFALQAPSSITSWIKGEYGIWTAFLALLARLFFSIPGELELPLVALLLVIVCPHPIINLRGQPEGVIFSLVIAAYLAFQHFIRAGSLPRAFEQGSIVASLAILCIVAVPVLLLI